MLGVLPPGNAVVMSQTFRVSDRANQYSTGVLNLELLLSEPSDKENRISTLASAHRPLRSIMHYSIEVQVSAKYSFNPDSQFLLVVNADTRPEVIQKIFKFVADLDMSMDVWNLSVYGNFISPLTGRCVLFEYVGKSVIVFANPFEYFGQGVRSAFGLLDPFIISYLAAADTHFLFPETAANDGSLTPWFSALTFPTYAVHSGTVEIDRKLLIPTLNCEQRSGTLSTHTYTMKSQLLKNAKSVLSTETKRMARSLNEYLPLHRFSVTAIPVVSKKIAGTVMVRQGLPRAARVVATFGRWDVAGDRISDFNTYMLIASLPFKTRARMFWDRVGGVILDPAAAAGGSMKSSRASSALVGAVELDSGMARKTVKGRDQELAGIILTRAEIDQKVSYRTKVGFLFDLLINRPGIPSNWSFDFVRNRTGSQLVL